jgi:AcrR family transcriptional regulator
LLRCIALPPPAPESTSEASLARAREQTRTREPLDNNVVRRHGWGGSPPADEIEARQRIIEAAMRCVDQQGARRFTLAHVASDLGVIRQTVYRYFSSTDDLLSAVGQVAVEDFLDELVEHLRRYTSPSAWVVEAVAVTLERLPSRPYLTLLLAAGSTGPFTTGVTSPEAMAVTHELFKRSRIDWIAEGYSPRDLDELIELLLRLVQSMVVDPPDPPRSPRALRRYLRRWIAPALR